jgi:hypothetical protein
MTMPMLTTTKLVPMTQQDQLTIEGAIWNAESDARRVSEQLVRKAKWLRDDMDRLIAQVEAGGSVNSLGEVQGSGSEVDRLCALYDEKFSQLHSLRWFLDRLGLVVEQPTDEESVAAIAAYVRGGA